MKTKTNLFFLLVLTTSLLYANGDKHNNVNTPTKTNGSPTRTYLDMNRISTQLSNDGRSDVDQSGNAGFEYPKGSGKHCIRQTGLLWGCKNPNPSSPSDTVSVGGSARRTGLVPGKIISPGLAEDPNRSNVRIYRVRLDIYPGGPSVDLSEEAQLEGISASALYDQYIKDWNEWPADDGAPTWIDYEGIVTGVIGAVIPGIRYAYQTVWYVANDLDSSRCKSLYGSAPLGIELQVTAWTNGLIDQAIFTRYKLINKSLLPLNDMYVSVWSNPDAGLPGDDYAGCDTTLSLGYVYNASSTDSVYDPFPPPAVGFDIIQGPRVKGVTGRDLNNNGRSDDLDTVIFNEKKCPGYVSLPMTAFYYFTNGDESVTEPPEGIPAGSTQFYNFFQGKIGSLGKMCINPTTENYTPYALSGNLESGTGWLDGQIFPAGDRKIGLASGPFNFASGDTQEVVVTEFAVGAYGGGPSPKYAVSSLKYLSSGLQGYYDYDFIPVPDTSVIPPIPKVSVYPFNKELIIKWNENTSDALKTEYFYKGDCKFQGYNVYQLPSANAPLAQGKLLASFDKKDGIKNVKSKYWDPQISSYVGNPFRCGSDLGVQSFYDVRSDALKAGDSLTNGTNYYFGITAYSCYVGASSVIETPMSIVTATPSSGTSVVDFPKAPPAPEVHAVSMNGSIYLSWDNNPAALNSTESFNENGYAFQGYNVYLLPSATASVADRVLLESSDIVDGIQDVTTQYFNQENNTYYSTPIKFGSNSGIKRYYHLYYIPVTYAPIENGQPYYLAVTSYSYNPSALALKGAESAMNVFTVVPNINSADTSSIPLTGRVINANHTSGNADASCTYKIVDPTKLKGSEYTLGFTAQPDSFTGAYIGRADGGNGGTVITTVGGSLNEAGTEFIYNVVINHTDSLSGPITGGGFICGNNSELSTQIVLNYNGSAATASGSWILSTDNKDALINQSAALVLNTSKYPSGEIVVPLKIASYPWYLTRDRLPLLNYQHLSSLKDTNFTIDGIRPQFDTITFSAPITYSSWKLINQADPTESHPLSVLGDGYSLFGFATGKAHDFFGGGQSATINDYSWDIELRFTGIADSNEAICKSGGSWATMLPHSSPSAQEMVRIPFEVWAVEPNYQMKCVITDRNIDGKSPWGNTNTPQWYRLAGRDYITFVSSVYNNPGIPLRNDAYATWTLILQNGEAGNPCKWHTGDILRIHYNNPIIPVSDTYSFHTPGCILAADKISGTVYTFSLEQNYPNPFNPATKIAYSIPKAGHVSMKVFDILGREVLTLVNTEMKAGEYSVDFNASNFASGVYFYKLKSGDKSIVKKMMLLK